MIVMAVPKNIIASNYIAQEANIVNMVSEKEQVLFHIKNQNCAAYKVIAAPLELLAPFFDPNKTWLTVGDNSGLEANYLSQRNQNVIASDLSDAILKEAKSEGLIKDYSKQNVERLTYNDNTFDYVVCKEAFHHFPQAYLGLYEMIRVSKTAAILVTEPIDILSKMSLLVFIKNICDKIDPLLINKVWKNRFSWESVGNYVFKVSEREMEKIAMGIGLPCLAFKRYDHYKTHTPIDGMSDIPINQKLYKRIQRKLKIRSFISRIGIIPHGSICTVIFKEQPNEIVLRGMRKLGFTFLFLPPNPYLK
jgi:2-polyprenyl-3-methyl-5-hydroxy-6-metoxy-1,4-benzoquinol methylase